MVELAEGASERGLAALIRAGDDDDALGVVQLEVVGDDVAVTELGRESEVEGAAGEDLLGVRADAGNAEAEPG